MSKSLRRGIECEVRVLRILQKAEAQGLLQHPVIMKHRSPEDMAGKDIVFRDLNGRSRALQVKSSEMFLGRNKSVPIVFVKRGYSDQELLSQLAGHFPFLADVKLLP